MTFWLMILTAMASIPASPAGCWVLSIRASLLPTTTVDVQNASPACKTPVKHYISVSSLAMIEDSYL